MPPGRAALDVQAPARLTRGEVAEFVVRGVPAARNPFDPAQIRLDARFRLPSGRELDVPGFWHQDYRGRLADGREVLTPVGAPGWRVRFTPTEAGRYECEVAVRLDDAPSPVLTASTVFVLPETGAPPAPGFARVAANRRYFATDQGAPLVLVGQCVCWHHQRGTEDYRDWFTAMADAGENYARLWMWPYAFGLECGPDTGLNYRLDRAWQLDRVFTLARERGIWLMLCLDYHGMFQTWKDYWGGNDNWKLNPYNAANGGPCATPGDFFTLPAARARYRARLRYLVARYGAFPNLLAWQFFNEIDNAYRNLSHPDVVAWHAAMGAWLKAHDPWRHLVTTSLTGGSERADFWRLPELDFAMYHSYGQSRPADALPRIVARYLDRYDKPVMIGEFGTDWRGWRREQDPYLRGWRQGIWAGALSGSVGTAMSWWWERIHAEGLYPTYRVLRDFLDRTRLGRGAWRPLLFPPPAPPAAEVGDLLPDGQPFAVTLKPDRGWGTKVSGRLAVAGPHSAAQASRVLNGFVQGSSHPDLRRPFLLSAWLGGDARLVLHLNSVSAGAILSVRVDNRQVFRRELPNRDGKHEVNDEYDEDIPIPLPAGKHLIAVRNIGADWFFLDWVRLEGVLPAADETTVNPTPEGCGVAGPGEVLLYLVNPLAGFPVNATTETIAPLRNGRLTLAGVAPGRYHARWYAPATGALVAETDARADAEGLRLELPPFAEDLAGHLTQLPTLALWRPAFGPDGKFRFTLRGGAPGRYRIETSTTLRTWSPAGEVDHTNLDGTRVIWPREDVRRFFRAHRPE
jgi:hypothetical protein